MSKNQREGTITLAGIRRDGWVNPFGASEEELLAGALEECGLMEKHTLINDKPGSQVYQDYLKKKNTFQEATRLGSILVKQGTVSQDQLTAALETQGKASRPLGELLVELEICTQQDIDNALRNQKTIREEFQRMEQTQGEWRRMWQSVLAFFSDSDHKLRD